MRLTPQADGSSDGPLEWQNAQMDTAGCASHVDAPNGRCLMTPCDACINLHSQPDTPPPTVCSSPRSAFTGILTQLRWPRMFEENPDTLPTPQDKTGPCPWCGRISNYESKPHGALAGYNSSHIGWIQTHHIATLTCSGCKRGTLVVTDQMGEGIHWYPAPGMGILDKQVNREVASAYDEGMRCLSIGASRAASVMFRSALHLFVKDKGGEKARGERFLKPALRHMKESGDLHKSLWDWADHLNQLGNEGAHPEDYDEVTVAEAEGLGKFVHHLIRHEYEMPAQLLRDQGLLNDGEPEDADGQSEHEANLRPSGGLNPSNSD